MQDRVLSESLVFFIREEIREFKRPITRETLIEEDLGVTGDDAADMIQKYGKNFNVNISNFNFTKYFNDEPSIFLSNKSRSVLSIGHLEKAIIEGRLDEEVINS